MINYSEEHINYLKEQKRKKILIIFFRFFILTTFLVLWEVLSINNIINPFLYSSPSKIINTISSLFYKQNLLFHISITLFEIIISCVISCILGLLIATLLWKKELLAKTIEPFLMIINSLPKVALGPLMIIWAGANITSIIIMSLTISLFTTIINIYQGFISVDKNYITMLESFKASKNDIFFKLILPINKKRIIETFKINISMNLIGVIMGELLVSKQGLGYLIMYGTQVFNLDLVLTSIFILGIISYIFYILFDFKYLKKSR